MRLFTTAFVFLPVFAFAQKGIDGMINAEKSFAAHSVQNGTRAAFIAYTDKDSKVFNKGEAVKAQQSWTNARPDSTVLSWGPELVEIAASGDFGYSTGPWTRKASKNDSVSVNGYFITVWRFSPDNDWKFMVDLGIVCTEKLPAPDVHQISGLSKPTWDGIVTTADSSMKAEFDFQELFKSKGSAAAYQRFLSNKNRRYLLGHCWMETSPAEARLPDSLDKEIKYEIQGGGVAKSGDLAYSYGRVRYKDRVDSYLRIWRREKQGWRIAIEVLRY